MTNTIKNKNRQQVVQMLMRLSVEAVRHDSGRIERRAWDICCDWNREHGDEEIFMCEDEDDYGNYRWFVEDDYFQYKN